jgi:ubiquinol oxidase
MELNGTNKEFEDLVAQLNDEEQLKAYRAPYDTYKTGLIPRFFGSLLVWCGNTVYGHEPSYLKFRAVEVIARVPYHSWASAVFTLQTWFYADEMRALSLSRIAKFSRFASDNETMHVVVISHLARSGPKAGFMRYTFIPVFFAFFYFWASYFLYLIKPKWSLELNYLFEQHAFDQYSRFLTIHKEELSRLPVRSEFLNWYGRHPLSQYDFFRSVRNDEIIHRNQSIREIEKHQ